jgi:phosphoglycolate phosphatase-like HAD superfamily hydrolase
MVDEWALEQWEDEILRRWNDINLFQMTRGINRFKGLAKALSEISTKYTPIVGVEALQAWADTAPALSNDGLVKAIDEAEDEDAKLCLSKALAWSVAVNESINRLPEDLKIPFPGAKEGLEAAHRVADVAVVSSANRDAVEEEWEKYGLLDSADVLLAQDCGSKSNCIAWTVKFGYEKDHVLMIGDAPGDCDAAEKNGVLYYPILVNWEEESWTEFVDRILPMFLEGKYKDIQEEKKQVFRENLGG